MHEVEEMLNHALQQAVDAIRTDPEAAAFYTGYYLGMCDELLALDYISEETHIKLIIHWIDTSLGI